MTWSFLLKLLARLPQGALSRAAGWLADRTLPSILRGPVIGGFARAVGIRQDEAEAPPAEYRSVGAYFVRRLRPDVRSWPDSPSDLGSPVDGVVGALGPLSDGQLIQAKGLTYDAGALVGDELEGARYHGGAFLTLYLSPRHYHRIHTPLPGEILRARSIPGRLMPVNLPAVRTIPDLFPQNERMVLFLEGAYSVALVAVGAFNVGRITVPFDPSWVTNRPRAGVLSRDVRQRVGVGDEVAAFHLGSTVVLLIAPLPDGRPLPPFAPELVPGAEVQLGRRIFAP
jgi:phosphatidylserine decarboxylase